MTLKYKTKVGNAWHTETVSNAFLFTGCHDINGNEIYTGDIVRYCDTVFNNFFAVVLCNGRIMQLLLTDDLTDWEDEEEFDSDNYTITGNIYDHPELLKKLQSSCYTF